MRLTFRQGCLIGAAAACSLVIAALLLEQFASFQSCSLCLLQRYMFIAIAVVFLIAAWHQPIGYGLYGYGGLLLFLMGIGIAIAARHVWLLHLPVEEQAPCGPGFEYLMNNYPLFDSLRFIVQGTAECSETRDLFLGLTLPMWSLLGFIGFFIYSLLLVIPGCFFARKGLTAK